MCLRRNCGSEFCIRLGHVGSPVLEGSKVTQHVLWNAEETSEPNE